MRQNIIAFAGLSHSGKDLLFNQITKLGRSEPDLNINQNVIYYDWIKTSTKKKEDLFNGNLIPPICEKIIKKISTLIYIHDISYQLLDEVSTDFQEIVSNISTLNKQFQVILLLNRGHLISNETERNRVRNEVNKRLQEFYPLEIPSYIVSLKGSDEQRLTNHIFTQIIHKASNLTLQYQKQLLNQQLDLNQSKQRQIKEIINQKMIDFGFAGAFLLSQSHKIILATGKSQGWQEKVGPQIIKMLDQYEAFDNPPKAKTSILRIEDFLMITQAINAGIKLILIGIESTFKFNLESYPIIEEKCLEMSNNIIQILN